jgi:hypothetical protein
MKYFMFLMKNIDKLLACLVEQETIPQLLSYETVPFNETKKADILNRLLTFPYSLF